MEKFVIKFVHLTLEIKNSIWEGVILLSWKYCMLIKFTRCVLLILLKVFDSLEMRIVSTQQEMYT